MDEIRSRWCRLLNEEDETGDRLSAKACLLDGVQQRICRERLHKECHAAYAVGCPTGCLVVIARYENDWERNLRYSELTAQFNPGFTTQVNVHNQAHSVPERGSLLEVLGGSKNLGLKAVSLEATLCALQHARVIVHDKYQLRVQAAVPLGSPERNYEASHFNHVGARDA